MPRFDGTGPRGEGMFTGRGEGYCSLRLPEPAPVIQRWGTLASRVGRCSSRQR
jgi:hypothetical protein